MGAVQIQYCSISEPEFVADNGCGIPWNRLALRHSGYQSAPTFRAHRLSGCTGYQSAPVVRLHGL